MEGILLGTLFLPLLLVFYPVGFHFSMVNFTYGARGLDPEFKGGLIRLFLETWVAAYGMEVLLRGILLRSLLTRFPWPKAFWIHLIVTNLAFGVFWGRQGLGMTGMGLVRFWILENLLVSFWAFFFMKTGSLLATGFFHAIYDFVRSVVLNDVSGPFETLYFYSAASEDFYWLILAVTFLAVSLQVWISEKWGMREPNR